MQTRNGITRNLFKGLSLVSNQCGISNTIIRSISSKVPQRQTKFYGLHVISRNKITTQSWAAERLKQRGETVEESNSPPQVVSAEMLFTPNEKVSALTKEILALNVMEMFQLFSIIEVSHCNYITVQ